MDNLNKEIAEKVLKWKQGESDLHWFDENGNRVKDGTPFLPDKEMNDAWLVVEKMKELNWFITIHDRNTIEGFFVIFRKLSEGVVQRESQVTAESVPLAICHAALAAIENR